MTNDIINASLVERYVNSLYYAFTTMTTCGYGDLHPYTSLERTASMAAMLVSSGIFGYIV